MSADKTNDPTQQEAPKIEFPCRYPIKVMGHASDSFIEEVMIVVRRHAPDTHDDDVNSRPSAKGNYLSITITIEAQGKDHLQTLFGDLKTLPDVKLVL